MRSMWGDQASSPSISLAASYVSTSSVFAIAPLSTTALIPIFSPPSRGMRVRFGCYVPV
jgi:hypothetical protein